MAQKTEKNWAAWGILFFVGVGVGYIFSQTMMNSRPMDTKETPQPASATHNTAMHETIEVSSDLPIPSIQMELTKDSKAGYNLSITTQNYTFTPEKVNAEPIPGEGHAHIYVDGIKIARLYGNAFHIPTDTLSKGSHEVRVTLNANDHSDWVYDGEHIQATGTIIVE